MNLIVRRQAEWDIDRAFAWYERQRAGLGDHYIAELERGLIHIEQHPALYPVTYRDVHKAPLRYFPYNIYYISGGAQLIVLRVLHQRRREPA